VPTALGKIVLGDVSDEPIKKIERFQPLADYLATNLGAFGIGVGEVKIAPDLETMADWMAKGEVDLYFDSLYPALIVANQSGAQPILRRWKGGIAEYHSLIFTRADSELTELHELNGHTLALEGPFSTSGYLLPLAHLAAAEFSLVEKGRVEDAVPKDKVGYTFTEDDENTIQWVLRGKVIAGAIDNQTFFGDIPEETQADLLILAETESFPRQVVMLRPQVEPALQEALKTLLVELDETPAGKLVLEQNLTSQYDEFPEGAEAALARMQTLYELVQP
jgi:phosphonate transport system substrate-binding protein